MAVEDDRVDDVAVLVVDDSEFFADMLVRELRDRSDLAATSCYDPEAAIEMISTHEIDCVVSDYLMPDTDGLELLDAVRSEDGDLPFIILTGQGNEDVASRAIKRGATDYLTKETVIEDSEFGLLLNRIRKGIGHHRAEKQLRERNEHLTVVNKMLRHDVRNDLQLVLGYLEQLDDHVEREARDHLMTAREAAENAVDITDTAGDILSAVVGGEEGAASIAVGPTVRTQAEEIDTAYPNATVAVEEPIPDVDVPGSDLLETVVRNLILNGIEHNDSEEPRVVVSVVAEDDDVELRVADNGPGIPDERKRRIFAEGESGTDGGSGIGLYLVETFVDRHGGRVDVEDRTRPFRTDRDTPDDEPTGSVFTVCLPKSERS